MNEALLKPLFEAVREAFPALPGCLAAWEGLTLGEAAAFDAPGTASPAAIRCMGRLAARSLGEATGRALERRLARTPAVLSANLHGIDCLPEMVQAVHFFGLRELLRPCGPEERRVIPVLSCGGVALQSEAYPRGLLLFRGEGAPLRLPLFPSVMQDTIVLKAPALTEQDELAMLRRWGPSLSEAERRAVDRVLRHALAPETLALSRFGEQAARINALLGAERFPDIPRVDVVYLELEEAAKELLIDDLQRPASVPYRMLFHPALRRWIIERLANVRGCWSAAAAAGEPLPRTGGNGTIFFWDTDERGRRHPLRLVRDGSLLLLERPGRAFPFTPEGLTDALRGGNLYPGLFAAYVTLTLEHGLHCYGGLYLAHYLPRMIQAVSEAFEAAGEVLPRRAAFSPLAAFPLTVHARTPDGLIPAGLLELLRGGGLNREALVTLARTPFADFLPATLWACRRYCAPHPRVEALPLPPGLGWKGITLGAEGFTPPKA